jgi:hypothetical protein
MTYFSSSQSHVCYEPCSSSCRKLEIFFQDLHIAGLRPSHCSSTKKTNMGLRTTDWLKRDQDSSICAHRSGVERFKVSNESSDCISTSRQPLSSSLLCFSLLSNRPKLSSSDVMCSSSSTEFTSKSTYASSSAKDSVSCRLLSQNMTYWTSWRWSSSCMVQITVDSFHESFQNAHITRL